MNDLSKMNSVTRMAINPGIPIPSAMPRISLVERPFNGTGDDVTCGDTKLDKVVVEPKVDAGVVIFRPLVILKEAGASCRHGKHPIVASDRTPEQEEKCIRECEVEPVGLDRPEKKS